MRIRPAIILGLATLALLGMSGKSSSEIVPPSALQAHVSPAGFAATLQGSTPTSLPAGDGSPAGGIRGFVTHAYYGTPIQGATLSWPVDRTTDAAGYYANDWAPVGYHTFVTSKPGYTSRVDSIIIEPAKWLDLNLQLNSPVAASSPASFHAFLPPSSSVTLTLDIANPGGLDLSYEILLPLPLWVTASPPSGTVAVSAQEDVNVRMATIPPYSAIGETYTATLTVYYNDPVQVESRFPLTLSVVNCTPIAGVGFSWSPTTPHIDEIATFRAHVTSTVSIAHYNWAFGDGQNGSEDTTSHRYTQSGNYTVTLTVTDACNNTAMHQDTVVVRPVHKYYLSAIVRGFR